MDQVAIFRATKCLRFFAGIAKIIDLNVLWGINGN
jgi:hypothetical protein